jgi:hypothetical protein
MMFLELELGADGGVGGEVVLVPLKKRYMQLGNCSAAAAGSGGTGKSLGAAGSAASSNSNTSNSLLGKDGRAEGKGVVVGPRLVGVKSGGWSCSGELSLWCEGTADLLPFLPAALQPKPQQQQQQQQKRAAGNAGKKAGGVAVVGGAKGAVGHVTGGGEHSWDFGFVGNGVDGGLIGAWHLREHRSAVVAGKGLEVKYQWLKGPVDMLSGMCNSGVIGELHGMNLSGAGEGGAQAGQSNDCLEHAGSAVIAALAEELLVK